MKGRFVIFIILVVAGSNGMAQKKSFKKDDQLLKTIGNNFIDAAAQYKILQKNLPEGKFPKTFFPATGDYEFSNSA